MLGLKIIQIIQGPYNNIYGLGDDNKIYKWLPNAAEFLDTASGWVLYEENS